MMEEKMLNWVPKKDQILLDEQIKRTEGGGLIVIRKIKKLP